MVTDPVKYISELVARARTAQKTAENLTQRQVDSLAAAIVYTFSQEKLATEIANQAFAETNMGEIQSKINKLRIKMPASLYYNLGIKSVGVLSEDPSTGITHIAKPLGVIAALVPSTNPEATPIFKGILSLRARNAIIFAPHPASKGTSVRVVNIMRDILEKNGLPKDLFIVIEEPSKSLSQELMRQCDITFATGGGDMVRAAYSCGKPAFGVGAGNCPATVDETADLEDAAHKIMVGKIGDNASGCSAENSVVIEDSVYDKMVALLQKEGGYLTNAEEKKAVQNVLWVNGALNRKIITKPASVIAEAAGIKVPDGTKFIMVEESGVGPEYPFSGEKLSLVLTVFRYKNPFENAIDLVNRILANCGLGHSCTIHSFNKEHILQYGLKTKTTRVPVRQANGTNNSGAWENGLPNTFAVGCGTWGGNVISESISQKHFFNNTWLSVPINRVKIPDKEIYGDLLDDVKL